MNKDFDERTNEVMRRLGFKDLQDPARTEIYRMVTERRSIYEIYYYLTSREYRK